MTLVRPTSYGFTGTQKGMTEAQSLSFLDLCDEFGVRSGAWLNNGDCVGADADAYAIWKGQGGHVYGYPPVKSEKRAFLNFDAQSEPADYLTRNKWIVNASDVLIACCEFMHETLRSGTWSTIRYADKQELPIVIIWPDGAVEKRNWYEDPFKIFEV